MENQILAIGPGSLEIYYKESGKAVQVEEKLQSKIKQAIVGNGRGYLLKIEYNKIQKRLYLISMRGVYSYDMKTKEFQTVFEGLLHDFGQTGQTILHFSFVGENEAYIGLLKQTEKETRNQLLQWTFLENAVKVPFTKEIIDVYSMEQNRTLIDLTDRYNASQEAVYVRYTYGNTKGDPEVKEDQQKQLNTELLAKKGPDVLLLDQLPAETFLKKGMLEDLTDLAEEQELFQTVSHTYEQDGHVYALPLHFKMMGVRGPKEPKQYIETFAQLTQSMQELSKENPEQIVLDQTYEYSTVDVLYHAYQKELKNKDGSVNEEGLRNFFLQLQTVCRLSDYAGDPGGGSDPNRPTCLFLYPEIISNEATEVPALFGQVQMGIHGITSAMDFGRVEAVTNRIGQPFAFFEVLLCERSICAK